MKTIEKNSMIPLYQQLIDIIKEKIQLGEYKFGEQIPSELQLSQMYDISRITVRNSIKILVEEEVLVKKHGKGTYVAIPKYVEKVSTGGSFTETWLQVNNKPRTKIISKEYISANQKIANQLNVIEGSQIICVTRLRIVDNIPVIYEIDYFSPEFEFLLNMDLTNKSLLETIRENTGISAEKFNSVFELDEVRKEYAKHLKCRIGTPVLRVSQKVMTRDFKLVYYNEEYVNSEVYKYSITS